MMEIWNIADTWGSVCYETNKRSTNAHKYN